jgi:uroporphyrinogen decarboxylase
MRMPVTTKLTPRERFVEALRFGSPDRIPFHPGGPRKSTLDAWHTQGLPANRNWYDVLFEELRIERDPTVKQLGPEIDSRMRPSFEEKVLEHRDGHYIVQDWKGNICEISDQFDVTYLRNAIDFVTRRWIKCPVETRADWDDMKRRYDIDDPGRFPADFRERAAKLRERTYASGLVFHGPFWQLREWLGAEGLCMLLLDEPEWAAEMIRFWQEFVATLLERAFSAGYVPDHVLFCEDMAFKEKAFISVPMCRRFLLPCWIRWTTLCRQAGVPVIEVDSDGYVGELIPLWIEAGVNCNSPLEVAAGNDLPAYARTYGRSMAWQGGVDKRKIAAGGAELRAEMERLAPVIRAGGYIPGCDHGVPPDVSWPNFLDYARQLARLTGWLA